MKIKTAELLDALKAVKPGLASKAIVEQTDHFIFDGNMIRTYNDKIAISYPFGFFASEKFRIAVKADEFFKLVSKIKIKEIEVEYSDNGRLIITAGSTEAEIMTSQDIVCPIVDSEEDEWKELPKNFAQAAYFCSFSAAGTLSVKVLTCLWIHGSHIISTDRYRASKYKLEGDEMEDLLLAAKEAKAMKEHKPTHYIYSDSWAHFKNKEGAILSCRIMDGAYPEKVFDAFEKVGEEITIPAELKDKIDIAKIITDSDEDQEDITVTVKKKKMLLRGKGSIMEIKENCDIDYKGAAFTFEVSPESLLEILSHTNKMFISEDKLYFAGGNFEHIISLK